MQPCEADNGGRHDPSKGSATKKKVVLITYLDPYIHQMMCFASEFFANEWGLFALFLSEPLLGRPSFCKNRGHVRSERSVGVCAY